MFFQCLWSDCFHFTQSSKQSNKRKFYKRCSKQLIIIFFHFLDVTRCSSSYPIPFTPNPNLALPPHGVVETDEEFDRRYEGYFNDKEIDGWMLRKRLTDIHRMDLIPEPKIIVAALRACRRVNDYALAIRYLEALYIKCGNNRKEIWPYLMGEIKPTMDELGISSIEEMKYDKPELASESPFYD